MTRTEARVCKHYHINTGGGWACWGVKNNQPCVGVCPDFIPKDKKDEK